MAEFLHCSRPFWSCCLGPRQAPPKTGHVQYQTRPVRSLRREPGLEAKPWRLGDCSQPPHRRKPARRPAELHPNRLQMVAMRHPRTIPWRHARLRPSRRGWWLKRTAVLGREGRPGDGWGSDRARNWADADRRQVRNLLGRHRGSPGAGRGADGAIDKHRGACVPTSQSAFTGAFCRFRPCFGV